MYDWPGNVRELRNVLEGAFNVATSRTIKKKYLPNYLLQELNLAGIDPPKEHIIRWSNGDDFNIDEATREYEKSIILAPCRIRAIFGGRQKAGHLPAKSQLQAK